MLLPCVVGEFTNEIKGSLMRVPCVIGDSLVESGVVNASVMRNWRFL